MNSRISSKLCINRSITKKIAYSNLKCFTSTRDLVSQRDQHFRSLLLSKPNLSTVELSNVARVLYKNKSSITDEEAKRFDDQALVLTKSLDHQQLRQVMSYYVFTNKVNKFVNYEINQRNRIVGLKDYTSVHVGSNIQSKFYLYLFGIRNCFFKILSKATGLSLK